MILILIANVDGVFNAQHSVRHLHRLQGCTSPNIYSRPLIIPMVRIVGLKLQSLLLGVHRSISNLNRAASIASYPTPSSIRSTLSETLPISGMIHFIPLTNLVTNSLSFHTRLL